MSKLDVLRARMDMYGMRAREARAKGMTAEYATATKQFNKAQEEYEAEMGRITKARMRLLRRKGRSPFARLTEEQHRALSEMLEAERKQKEAEEAQRIRRAQQAEFMAKQQEANAAAAAKKRDEIKWTIQGVPQRTVAAIIRDYCNGTSPASLSKLYSLPINAIRLVIADI